MRHIDQHLPLLKYWFDFYIFQVRSCAIIIDIKKSVNLLIKHNIYPHRTSQANRRVSLFMCRVGLYLYKWKKKQNEIIYTTEIDTTSDSLSNSKIKAIRREIFFLSKSKLKYKLKYILCIHQCMEQCWWSTYILMYKISLYIYIVIYR